MSLYSFYPFDNLAEGEMNPTLHRKVQDEEVEEINLINKEQTYLLNIYFVWIDNMRDSYINFL